MGAELYLPKGMDYCEWLCQLMCGDPEEEDDAEEKKRDEQLSDSCRKLGT